MSRNQVHQRQAPYQQRAPLFGLLLLLLLLTFGAAWAQDAGGQPPPAPPAALDAAPARADAAVEAWLQQQPLSLSQLTSLTTEQLCQEIPQLLSGAAPPPGTEVRIEGRVERPSQQPGQRIFTYAAVRPGDQLDVVEVRLLQHGDAGDWTVEYVGFRSALEPTGVRAWLQTPMASYLFIAFTIVILMLLINRGSFFRRWLAAGLVAIRQHRRLVISTLVVLYALFGLGALLGSSLPESCEQAVVDLVTSAVTSLGATQAYGSGNIARAAATTFYQNFVVVTVSVTFSLAVLLGVPAYLFAGLSFFTQGIPFGLLGSAGPVQLLAVLLLLVLELTAYFLVVAGGGMLLATLLKRGEGAFYRGYRKLLLMLPIALVLLLVGAWYESLILIAGF